MKSAMYQVIGTRTGQATAIKISVSEPRTGFEHRPIQNSKLAYSAEMTVEAAKSEFAALAAEGYSMSKGQNILR